MIKKDRIILNKALEHLNKKFFDVKESAKNSTIMLITKQKLELVELIIKRFFK